MTLTIPISSLSRLIGYFGQPVVARDQSSGQMSQFEDARAERELLHEMICRNPEAIQTDLGLMAFMSHFPRQY